MVERVGDCSDAGALHDSSDSAVHTSSNILTFQFMLIHQTKKSNPNKLRIYVLANRKPIGSDRQ